MLLHNCVLNSYINERAYRHLVGIGLGFNAERYENSCSLCAQIKKNCQSKHQIVFFLAIRCLYLCSHGSALKMLFPFIFVLCVK